jgi:phage terminase small subunit
MLFVAAYLDRLNGTKAACATGYAKSNVQVGGLHPSWEA